MSADPALILQSGRLGDLILTFPLLLDLQRQKPERPVWIVSEEQFFRPLMPFAPNAVFFPPQHLPQLARAAFDIVINLGSSPAAAVCAGSANANARYGPISRSGVTRIGGFWHLYRSSLTHNNRHNVFHWADLYRLDIFRGPRWATAAAQNAGRPRSGRIGLVLGASESAKRPEAVFWARLAVRLAASGHAPVFLGGAAEVGLGLEVARLSGLRNANFCGRLGLTETASLMRGLDLLITPDTGPMHLADWLGVPVLNLSMGPVNSRETGPLSPGQWVLRPSVSCEGCWSCGKGRLICREAFVPSTVARVASALAAGHGIDAMPEMRGMELLRSFRDELGLYKLAPQVGAAACGRDLLDGFWRAAFLRFSDCRWPEKSEEIMLKAAEALCSGKPALAGRLAHGISVMIGEFGRFQNSGKNVLAPDYWRKQPPMSRLFAGNAQMYLQNNDYSAAAWQNILERLFFLRRVLAGA